MIFVGVFLLAFIPRAVYLLWAAPPFAGYYWDLSSSVLQNGSLALDGVRTTRFEPLYPWFLAGARLLTHDSIVGVQLLQCAAAALGAVCLFAAARSLADRRVALIASALFAVHPLLVRHASDLSDSALTTTTLMLFVLAFVRANNVASAAVAGVCLGMTILTRSVAMPLLLLAPALVFSRRAPARALALAAAAVATIVPMLARDVMLTGALAPARHGVNLFIGNSEYTAALVPDYSPDVLQHYADAVAAGATGISPEDAEFPDKSDAALARLAWTRMRSHPWQTATLKLRNLWYFFSPFLVPSRELLPSTTLTLGPAPGAVRVEGAPLRPLADRLAFTVFSSATLLLAAGGVVIRRTKIADEAILWCVVVTFAGVYAIYFPATRYNAPALPPLLFYAAAALDRLLVHSAAS